MKRGRLVADLDAQTKIHSKFDLGVDYFNSSIFAWEPFVEKTQVVAEYWRISKKEGWLQSSRLSFPSHKKLHINISYQFLERMQDIYKTLQETKLWQKLESISFPEDDLVNFLKSIKNKREKISEGEELKNRTQISLIQVHNRTGYEI